MANEFDGDNRQDDDNRQCVDIGLAHVCNGAANLVQAIRFFACLRRIYFR